MSLICGPGSGLRSVPSSAAGTPPVLERRHAERAHLIEQSGAPFSHVLSISDRTVAARTVAIPPLRNSPGEPGRMCRFVKDRTFGGERMLGSVFSVIACPGRPPCTALRAPRSAHRASGSARDDQIIARWTAVPGSDGTVTDAVDQHLAPEHLFAGASLSASRAVSSLASCQTNDPRSLFSRCARHLTGAGSSHMPGQAGLEALAPEQQVVAERTTGREWPRAVGGSSV